MSYILEALRRAEAERERGQVPGLHTQAALSPSPHPSPSARPWAPWAAGAVLMAAGVGGGLWWIGRTPDSPATAPAAAPAVARAPVPAPALATAPPAAAVVTAAPPLADAPTPTPPAAVVAPAPAAPAPAVVSPPAAAPAPAVAVVTPAPAKPAAPPAARATPPAPTAEARLPLWSELPEATRRELPKLALGGSVYSDDPASRLVIVNGEVLHEGARLGPDLVVEQIRPRELVLRFRGQRYRLPV